MPTLEIAQELHIVLDRFVCWNLNSDFVENRMSLCCWPFACLNLVVDFQSQLQDLVGETKTQIRLL